MSYILYVQKYNIPEQLCHVRVWEFSSAKSHYWSASSFTSLTALCIALSSVQLWVVSFVFSLMCTSANCGEFATYFLNLWILCEVKWNKSLCSVFRWLTKIKKKRTTYIYMLIYICVGRLSATYVHIGACDQPTCLRFC